MIRMISRGSGKRANKFLVRINALQAFQADSRSAGERFGVPLGKFLGHPCSGLILILSGLTFFQVGIIHRARRVLNRANIDLSPCDVF
jgi:hypothetical protein